MGTDLPLPDFQSPPLDEVVVGVQFSAPPEYSILHASEIWALFKSDFPIVSEQPRLEPQFEIFGGNPQPSFQFNFGPPPTRGRLWFSSVDKTHLFQFQEDRLLLNWRRQGQNSTYPRHEKLIEVFSDYLGKLDRLFKVNYVDGLNINQAEVTYLNTIPLSNFSEAGDWIKLFGLPELKIELLNATLTEIVESAEGKPTARMSYDVQPVWEQVTGQKAIRLSLTCRGKPGDESTASALSFIAEARENIVRRFCDLTTEKAHEIWGRQT
jgi:uncharacterized protein (TIGR04255 family)